MIDWLITTASWTLRNSLEASVLIGLIAVLYILWRGRLSSGFWAALWILVGIRLILPASPESSFSLFNLTSMVRETSVSPGALHLAEEELSAVEVLQPVPIALVAPGKSIDIKLLLALIWISGIIGILGAALVRQIMTKRWVHKLPEVEDTHLREMMKNCAKQAGVRSTIQLVKSSQMTGIAVFGGLRPTHVIIPIGFSARYTESEIRGIFLHELAHVRRGDLLWNWATLAIEAWHWFNPLVWWAGRRFMAERELVCDRFVLKRLPQGHHFDYGRALLKTLEFGVPSTAPNPALVPFLSHKSELKHRINMIRKSHIISPVLQAIVSILAIAACAMTFTSALTQEREGGEGRSPDTGRESPRDGDRLAREGESRTGPRDGEGARGTTPGDGEGEKRTGPRDGDGEKRTGPRDGEGEKRTGPRDGEGDKRTGPRDGEGEKRTGPRDGEGDKRTGPRDGEGEKRTGPRDGEGDKRTGPRDGEGDKRTGPRDGEGESRTGPRDGEGESRTGPRDGEGEKRTGPRDGEGEKRTTSREGEGEMRRGPRDGEGEKRATASEEVDTRMLTQLTRIYKAYDKNGDKGVSFEEWLSMKDGEMPSDRRAREKGWFDQADANHDDKMTLGEWIDWKSSQGRQGD